jgi:uncharacterized protein (TIGR03435 family)
VEDFEISEFFLASPAARAAGDTGPKLEKRIEGILTKRFTGDLGSGRRVLLASAATLVIAAPVMLGLMSPHASAAPQSSSQGTENAKEIKFEVLSIRPIQPGAQLGLNANPSPNGFVARLSIFQLINLAYAPGDSTTWGTMEVRNLPSWDGAFYDIDARVAAADLTAWQHQSSQHELLRSAIRAALKERCKLAVHEEPSKAADLELVVGKRGPRLQAAAPGFASRIGMKLQSGGIMGPEVVNAKNVMHFYGATMEDLARWITPLSGGIPVYDRTGLTGRYDFILREQTDPLDTPSEPNYFLDKYPIDHLGLELKRGTELRPALVVDHIERPSAN